jgi:hypothetical protein
MSPVPDAEAEPANTSILDLPRVNTRMGCIPHALARSLSMMAVAARFASVVLVAELTVITTSNALTGAALVATVLLVFG